MDLTLDTLIQSNYVRILISSLVSMAITIKSIPLIIKFGDHKSLMDNPIKQRSSHFVPIPTFGGVALFTGTMIGYHLWNYGEEGLLLHKMIVGFVVLFFLGLKDDILVLDPIKKVLSQIIAAALVVIGSDLRLDNFFGIFGIYEVSYLVSITFTIFFFLVIINAFNLIDGIDGLSAGIGMINTFFLGLWFLVNSHWSLAAFALCLSLSLLGFLFFNFSKTQKIFMGDTGSLIIGYVITILSIKFIHLNSSHSFRTDTFVSAPILVLVSLSIPLFDFLRVLIIRIITRRPPWKGDRLHLHHILIDLGLSHIQASFVLYVVTIGITTFTYYLRSFFSNTQLMLLIAAYFVLYLFICQTLEKKRVKLLKL